MEPKYKKHHSHTYNEITNRNKNKKKIILINDIQGKSIRGPKEILIIARKKKI